MNRELREKIKKCETMIPDFFGIHYKNTLKELHEKHYYVLHFTPDGELWIFNPDISEKEFLKFKIYGLSVNIIEERFQLLKEALENE